MGLEVYVKVAVGIVDACRLPAQGTMAVCMNGIAAGGGGGIVCSIYCLNCRKAASAPAHTGTPQSDSCFGGSHHGMNMHMS